ncbi:TetR/AcrR family transcriptional regulator [Kitasatospora brasiliensis]|uniref:TetR/AcrR family transcriptional regulator n=1 Tax=Kitasatospora brasiliensis TaxID=3058040 RepID=UPI0029307A28|nr:TetR/AcrR family transcriptional regulator [Kitasatospora sp. K002]
MRVNPDPAPAGHSSGRSLTTDARRTQIVAATIETVAELGYARASFAQIAKRAKLSSVRLISYHFEDKEDLFRALVGTVQEAAQAFMRPRIQARPEPAAQLAAYIEANLEFLAEHPVEVRALVDVLANARREDGSPLVSSASFDTPVALLVEHLRNGQLSGDFRPFDAEAMATAIRASIDAAANRLSAGDDFDARAYGRELVTLFTLATRNEEAK